VPVAPGERFVVLVDHRVDNVTSWALTSWAASMTGSFECTLPAGLVLVSKRSVRRSPGLPVQTGGRRSKTRPCWCQNAIAQLMNAGSADRVEFLG
jgi:hypothetical protein